MRVACGYDTNKHNGLHLAQEYARIFVHGHYMFLEAHNIPVLELYALGTDMSADKYPSIFSSQMEIEHG